MGVPGDGKADVRSQVSPSDLSEDRGWPAVAMVPLTVALTTKAGERSIAEYGTDVGCAREAVVRCSVRLFLDDYARRHRGNRAFGQRMITHQRAFADQCRLQNGSTAQVLPERRQGVGDLPTCHH